MYGKPNAAHKGVKVAWPQLGYALHLVFQIEAFRNICKMVQIFFERFLSAGTFVPSPRGTGNHFHCSSV